MNQPNAPITLSATSGAGPVRLPLRQAGTRVLRAHVLALLAGAGVMAYAVILVATGILGHFATNVLEPIMEAAGGETAPREGTENDARSDRPVGLVLTGAFWMMLVAPMWARSAREAGYPSAVGVALSLTQLAFFIGGAAAAGWTATTIMGVWA